MIRTGCSVRRPLSHPITRRSTTRLSELQLRRGPDLRWSRDSNSVITGRRLRDADEDHDNIHHGDPIPPSFAHAGSTWPPS